MENNYYTNMSVLLLSSVLFGFENVLFLVILYNLFLFKDSHYKNIFYMSLFFMYNWLFYGFMYSCNVVILSVSYYLLSMKSYDNKDWEKVNQQLVFVYNYFKNNNTQVNYYEDMFYNNYNKVFNSVNYYLTAYNVNKYYNLSNQYLKYGINNLFVYATPLFNKFNNKCVNIMYSMDNFNSNNNSNKLNDVSHNNFNIDDLFKNMPKVSNDDLNKFNNMLSSLETLMSNELQKKKHK